MTLASARNIDEVTGKNLKSKGEISQKARTDLLCFSPFCIIGRFREPKMSITKRIPDNADGVNVRKAIKICFVTVALKKSKNE